jgi:hypothetical protein
VGISTVFEIFGHFLFRGLGPHHMVMTYIPSDPHLMLLDTRNKNIQFKGRKFNGFQDKEFSLIVLSPDPRGR